MRHNRLKTTALLSLAGLLSLTSCSQNQGLTIKTEPAGAALRVNGDNVGLSPVTIDIGKHKPVRIMAEKKGFFPVDPTIYPQMTASGAILWGPRNRKSRKLENPIIIKLKPVPQQAPALRPLPKNWR